MLGFPWTRPGQDTSIDEGSSMSHNENDGGAILPIRQQPSQKVENKLLTRLKEAGGRKSGVSADAGPPMRQVTSTPVAAHPSSSTWTPALVPSFTGSSAMSSSTRTIRTMKPKSGGYVPGLISSSTTSSRDLYPKLDPPINQRSTALKALLESTSSAPSAPMDIPGRTIAPRRSVSDLVKSFEEEGVLSKSREMEKERELRKVPSRGA